MLKNFLNLYVIFAILMIVAVFFQFDVTLLRNQYTDINTILQKMDFTGFTGTFRTAFLS